MKTYKLFSMKTSERVEIKRIEVEGLFGSFDYTIEANLSNSDNRLLLLYGDNGSGKTTVMRSILNYLRIEEGEINVFNLDHRKDSLEIRKRIGYIPGDLAVYDNFTGEELIKYFNHFRQNNTELLEELKSIFTVNLKQKTLLNHL